jgi:hypothetical protein
MGRSSLLIVASKWGAEGVTLATLSASIPRGSGLIGGRIEADVQLVVA